MSGEADAGTPRPLTGGAVMSGASRVTVALAGAAATILVARILGASGTGTFAVALTTIYVLTVVGTLGVEHGVAYYVSRGTWPARDAFRVVQLAALAVGVPLVGLGLLAYELVPSAFGGLTFAMAAIVAIAVPFSLSWYYATYVALAVDRYEAYVVPPAIQAVVALAGVGVLAAVDGVRGAVIGLAVSHVATAVAVLLRAPAWVPHGDGVHREPGQVRRAISFGIKGYLANALQLLNYRLDVYVLSAVASSAAVGRYSVAMSVTSVMWLLPPALSDVLFPRVAALSARGEHAEDHREMVEVKSLRHTVVVVAASAVAVALALVVLVVPVYGADFRAAIGLGLILLPGVALIGVAGVLSATIVGRGRPELALRIALVTTPVTIALYAVLIPPLEATGAALASSLSYTTTFVLATVYYRRVTGRSAHRFLLPTASELADYRALPAAVRAWADSRRRRD